MALPRAVLKVEGAETLPFLDSLLTNDMTKLADGAPLFTALLSPQGKLVADLIAWPVACGVLLDVDVGRADDLLRRLKLYRLRTPVAIEDVSDAWRVIAGEGTPDPRLAALPPRSLAPAVGDRVTEEPALYRAQRLAFGVPDLARDAAPEEIFALEGLLDELQGVDFHKGCFVGQENVSRMKRRATTRKKFCPVAFDGAPPPFGAVVRAGEAELGSIRTAGAGRALALLRLDRAQEAIAAGESLVADGQALRLEPPSWLLLPPVTQPNE